MTEPVQPTAPRADGLPARETVAPASDRASLDLARRIVEGLREEGVRPYGREGTSESHWVLVDFGSVIVHVFTPPEREYYQLEKHWAAARIVLQVQ